MDTSYTVRHRNHYIHCHHDRGRRREVCRVQAPSGVVVARDVSFSTAKRKINARTKRR